MAIPQILQQLSGAQTQPQRQTALPNNLAQIKNAMSAVRAAGNPQAMIQMMAQQNPQVQQAISYMNENGGGQAAFFKLAKEKGVDPNEILNALR